MRITLPPQLEHFIEAKVRTGGCADADEYIQEVLIQEWLRETETQKSLDGKLLEAIHSGDPQPLEPDWKERVRREAREQAEHG